MDEQLGLLIRLQELDAVIRGFAERKKNRPAMLAALEARRAASKADLEGARENLVAAQKNKRDRDQDLDVGAQKVAKLKARTSEIKNNKEYQALLKEIETAEQENKAIEDGILVLMEKIDAATKQIGEAEQRAKEETAAIQKEQESAEAEFMRVDEELAVVERDRNELAQRVEPGLLSQYQNLLASKGGTAMAEARSESCSGCYMSIPPQVFVNVKKNMSIIYCPHCSRILYFKEAITQN